MWHKNLSQHKKLKCSFRNVFKFKRNLFVLTWWMLYHWYMKQPTFVKENVFCVIYIISRYLQIETKSMGVEQMDFTSFFRTSALTDGGFGSIFLFTIRATTLLYFLYNNHLHFCLYQAAAQKLAAKTIQTAKQTFPSTNCCFCVSFAVKK